MMSLDCAMALMLVCDTSPSPVLHSAPPFLCRYLLDRSLRVNGEGSLRNPNVLEVSLNNAFRDVDRNPSRPLKAAAYPLPDLPSCQEVLMPPMLPQYTHSGCPCVPCLKVVTVNRVQSTYAVPTFSTAGGDLDSLNALCELLAPAIISHTTHSRTPCHPIPFYPILLTVRSHSVPSFTRAPSDRRWRS
jgi:hypothetical protein